MKRCPCCGEEIQDDAVKCRYCGEWLNKESRPSTTAATFEFPKIWPGYVVGLLFFIFEIFRFIISEPPFIPIAAVFMLLLWLIGFAYWCVSLYKLHKTILTMADNRYPISPARAVGFGFIPFYNLYWMFKWPSEAINFINTRDKSGRLNGWFPGLILLLSSLLGILVGALWFFGSFGVLAYLIKALKRSLAVQPGPMPYKSQSTPISTGVIVALICLALIPILGLLAAIAIPNLVRAKGIAQTVACRVNLNTINIAKQMWKMQALENGAEKDKTPSWLDLVPTYLKEKPTCPRGGIYEIGNVDSPPTCSIEDNGTENTTDDHILNRYGE